MKFLASFCGKFWCMKLFTFGSWINHPLPPPKKIVFVYYPTVSPLLLGKLEISVFSSKKKSILQEHINICWLKAKKILDVNLCAFHNLSSTNIARARQRCWLFAKNIIKQELSQPTTRTIRIVKCYGQPVPLSGNTFHKMETNKTKTSTFNGTIIIFL